MDIRLADSRDAGALGAIHVHSWRAAYRGVFPDEYLDGLDPHQRAEGWSRYFAAERDVREALWVATGDGVVVGFALAGAARDDDAAAGELYAIYVSPERWGSGCGRALMGAATDGLKAAQFEEAVLWVLEENSRARRFYEAAGWRPDGVMRREESYGFPITEVRYRRPLG